MSLSEPFQELRRLVGLSYIAGTMCSHRLRYIASTLVHAQNQSWMADSTIPSLPDIDAHPSSNQGGYGRTTGVSRRIGRRKSQPVVTL